MPVHIDWDSSNPPTSAPNRFDPNASALNRSFAKPRMNTMPAKNTGSHSTPVATSAFNQMDWKKKVSSGMAQAGKHHIAPASGGAAWRHLGMHRPPPFTDCNASLAGRPRRPAGQECLRGMGRGSGATGEHRMLVSSYRVTPRIGRLTRWLPLLAVWIA